MKHEQLKKVVKEMKNRNTEALTDEEIKELKKETEGAVRLSEEARLSEIVREYEDLLKDKTDVVELRNLAEEIETAGKDTATKIIILKSDGERAFCAGASFDELASIEDFETGVRFFSGFAEVINAARKCPKLILGRIHGKAVGGGVGLVAACDYALATEKSSVRLSEISLGIGPFVIAPAIERKIGTARFTAMTIDHEWRSAEWCLKTGLYQAVLANVEKFWKNFSHSWLCSFRRNFLLSEKSGTKKN